MQVCNRLGEPRAGPVLDCPGSYAPHQQWPESPHFLGRMWGFGLLLLRYIVDKSPKEHSEAMNSGIAIAYSASLAQAEVLFSEQVRLVS